VPAALTLIFDIGFFEPALIFLVALIVIGPDKLPGLARTAGLWAGKGQAMVRSVKADIDREPAASKMKGKLIEKEDKEALTDTFADVKELAEEVRCNFRLDASGKVDARDLATPKQDDRAKTS